MDDFLIGLVFLVGDYVVNTLYIAGGHIDAGIGIEGSRSEEVGLTALSFPKPACGYRVRSCRG